MTMNFTKALPLEESPLEIVGVVCTPSSVSSCCWLSSYLFALLETGRSTYDRAKTKMDYPSVTLTSWSYVIFCAHYVSTFIGSFLYCLKNENECWQCCKTFPFGCFVCFCVTSSILGNITSSIYVLVTTVYLGYIHDHGKGLTVFDFCIHVLPTVMMILDNVISGRPMRLIHVIYPLTFGIVYIFATLIFWGMDPKNNIIYTNILNWNDTALTTVKVIGVGFLITIVHAIHCLLYQTRSLVLLKLRNTESSICACTHICVHILTV